MWLLKQIKEEPVMFYALIQATLSLVLGLSLIPSLTQDKMGYILAFTAALLAFLTRRVVTPTANPKTDDGTPLMPKQ